MEEKKAMPEPIPYIAHESAMARNERMVKRLIIALVISVIMIVVSNLSWLYVWQQYDYTSDTVTVDSKDGGNANYIGEDGNVYNGESGSKEAETKTEK